MKQRVTARQWFRVGRFYDALLAFSEGGRRALYRLLNFQKGRRPSRWQKRLRLFPQFEVLEGRCLPSRVTGYAWDDANGDSSMDNGEPGLANVCVGLYDATTNYSIAWTSTDNNGYYEFDNLAPGTYILRVFL